VAQHLATGDLDHAAQLLPGVARPLLAHSYAEAFRALTHGLAVVTLLSAAIVFWFLGRKSAVEADADLAIEGAAD
jgi:hypothetical protein